jgi:beta-fructofuranosidase
MSLRLPDKWIWDFWLVRAGDEQHIFYLQAPRVLGEPALRHRNASIGHAVSRDLRSWRVLPDALHPGPDGAWDDLATWTGSAIAHDGRWYMLYTGINRAERGLVQRIGLAASEDLVS